MESLGQPSYQLMGMSVTPKTPRHVPNTAASEDNRMYKAYEAMHKTGIKSPLRFCKDGYEAITDPRLRKQELRV